MCISKHIAKRIISRVAVTHGEEAILEKIKNYSVVSFDVFDTLLKRDVADPADVFVLMERESRDVGGLSVEGFAKLRMEAEKRAKQIHTGREVTLQDIYVQMPIDDAARQELMDVECRMELELSVQNESMRRIYMSCLEQGKKVLFLSDMYLPADIVGELLRKNGYSKGTLYVSSESGFTKRSGALFSYVQEREAIDRGQWLHIGDGILPDYIAARKNGVHSVLVERESHENEYFEKKLYRSSADYRQLNHFIDTRIGRYTDPYERIGYAVLGPLLYGFSKWLDETIPKDETIVFLAREGALLQRAFEIVSRRKSVFLYISRRAAHMAYLAKAKDYSDAAQSKFHTIINKPTYREMIEAYGFSDKEIEEILEQESLDATGIIRNSGMELALLKKLWPKIRERANRQYSLLQEYLDQLGVKGNCSVVDVGWQGTIQAILSESGYCASGQSIKWKGYYYGIKQAGKFKIERNGFLFEGNNNKWMNEGIINSAPFFEMLFLATGGTTTGYRRADSGGIEPILGCSDNDEEWNQRIQSIQNLGIRFVEDLSHSPARELITFDASVAADNYQAIARVPSRRTLELFRGVKHGDGRSYNLGYNLGYYIFHPRKFIFDFETKRGRVWFLKDLFKIPLPYMATVNLARRLFSDES